jgi:hypothetical protein
MPAAAGYSKNATNGASFRHSSGTIDENGGTMETTRHAFLAWSLALLSCTAAEVPEPKGERAIFGVLNTVVVAAPPRFGANLHPPAMTHWNTEPWHNQWWLAPSINPVTARHKGFVTEGGADFLEDNSGSRLGYWDVFRDGFFDGGSVAVYRYSDGIVSLLREGGIKRYQASKGGPNRLTFAETGPVPRAGDFYVLTTERTEFPSSVTRTWGKNPWWLVSGFQLQGQAKQLWEQGVRLRIVEDAPPDGGGGSLALTVPDGVAAPVRVGYWLLSAQQPDWPRFREGKIYVARMWLRQEGLASGAVEVQIATLKTATLKVSGEWQEHRIEFVGAPPRRGAEPFTIGTREAGTVYIDNVTIVEKDGPPPYGFYPEIVDTLRRFRPNTLRLWVLQENRGFGKCLDDALGLPTESNLTFKEQRGAATTDPLGLHQQLMLCQQVGTDPWIIASTMFSTQEQKNLIEYLAGPADSPYGRRRADMGQTAPWTTVFDHIKLEMGNETWNGMFQPQGFSGKPEIYGAYCEYMFGQMKNSPCFDDDAFQLVINGWVAQPKNNKWGWGARALRNAPSAEAIDVAYYTGGWDSVGLMKAESEAESWMNILTFSRRMLLPRAEQFKQTADELAEEQGRPGAVEALVYEAGPGYTLPGPGKFDLEEQKQGKSLAHAINALDIFMMNLRNGFGDQSFFLFKNGHYWASHNRQWGEHIAWKALGMRNALLEGDLITAQPVEMVTLDVPETQADVVNQSNSANRKVKSFPALPDLPLIDCYPFRDGKRYSFMFISRRLSGQTPVVLNLPYEPASRYTLHALVGDHPGLHNIDEEAVTIQTTEHDGMTRRHEFSMPPHSVVVLVSEAR